MEFITELHEQLEKELNDIALITNDIIERSKLSFQACERAMMKLKTFLTTYVFKSAAEEIYFFKELKPKFYSRLIYHIKVFEIETKRPDGSVRTQRKYLNKHLAIIRRYSEINMTFYKYYRSGAAYMDAVYFTRDKFDMLIGFDINYFDCDQSFCTTHDYTVAMLLANERLVNYLNKKIVRLNNSPENSKLSILEEMGLNWVETKTGFVELMYGLQSLGAFYNVKTKTKADIKEIARFFEVVLEMDLGNFYRLYYDIRIRKKERTSFLDKLKDSLIKRMDEDF